MSSIRHQINIAAPARTVWRALTTEEGLTSWWVDEARVVAEKGGRIVLRSEGDDGEMVEEVGMFHEIRPTRKIEIAWDTRSPAPTAGTRVQFTVARDGDETRVSVTHSGGGVLDDDEARAALEKSWKQALRALRGSLED
ncbi:MAG: SRPBCC domain-containing protein [Deltaproteobacteria bacterium]|nr:MAG: SRPBCC domain-containing protein [Deltaproteobacteria bacterium]